MLQTSVTAAKNIGYDKLIIVYPTRIIVKLSLPRENDLIQDPKSKFTHAIRKAVLGLTCLNIHIATKVIGTYDILNMMLVIVTSMTGTLKARANGAATGVSDV